MRITALPPSSDLGGASDGLGEVEITLPKADHGAPSLVADDYVQAYFGEGARIDALDFHVVARGEGRHVRQYENGGGVEIARHQIAVVVVGRVDESRFLARRPVEFGNRLAIEIDGDDAVGIGDEERSPRFPRREPLGEMELAFRESSEVVAGLVESIDRPRYRIGDVDYAVGRVNSRRAGEAGKGAVRRLGAEREDEASLIVEFADARVPEIDDVEVTVAVGRRVVRTDQAVRRPTLAAKVLELPSGAMRDTRSPLNSVTKRVPSGR